MPRSRPLRVFIGFVEVAGYFSRLKSGLEQLGCEVTFVDLSGHPFQYSSHAKASGGRLLRGLRTVAAKIIHSPHRLRGLHRILQTIVGVPLLAWGLLRYDVFIFGFGSSLLGLLELPILKWSGKKVIHVFCGTDCRPPYLNGTEMVGPGALSTASCIRVARRRKRRLQRVERYADAVVNHAPQAQFMEKPFVSWAYVGIPFEAPEPAADAPSERSSAAARILHAPSNSAIKGTDVIRRTVETLKSRGLAIDYVEISGRPHAEMLGELARCDLVVDELYSDNYMATLAVEAAFFGKPTLVAGYAREELEREYPPDIRPPVEYIHPDQLEAALTRLVTDEHYRLDLGRRAREFVCHRWSPANVAKAYLRIIHGDVPPEWFCDPGTIRHPYGMGMPQDVCCRVVRDVVARGGRESLQLADKPELERRVAALAESDAV
jgi:hypothetical protein